MTDSSDLFYPNRFARLLIQAMQTELGAYSTESLLKNAGLPSDLPPDDLERVYPFTRLSAINHGLFDMYGDQGARGLAQTVGRAWFTPGLATLGAFAAFTDPAFMALPGQTRADVGLKVLAEIFSRLSDQDGHIEASPHGHRWIVEHSPFIFENVEAPVCYLLAGLAASCLSAATGGDAFYITEVECRASGAPHCIFAIGQAGRARDSL
ncbi:MAG: 4-vinyl reductase [Anaerolineae bacterium]|nr:4-vinyl reductase [Anaerolineae bacterium]